MPSEAICFDSYYDSSASLGTVLSFQLLPSIFCPFSLISTVSLQSYQPISKKAELGSVGLKTHQAHYHSQKAIYDYPIKKKIEDSLILLASIGVLLLIASIRMSPNQGPSVLTNSGLTCHCCHNEKDVQMHELVIKWN